MLNKLRTGESRCVVTTDLRFGMSTGHLPATIINYDLPSRDTYLKRAGRSGCFGRRGLCISFVLPGEMENVQQLRNYFSTRIEELPSNLTGIS